MPKPADRTGKNIVLCSDGTGNSYTGTESNIRRLYSWIEQWSTRQISCYHPGIGTLPLPEGRTSTGRAIRHLRELCFGAGVMDDMVHLYTFLAQHYEPGDRVFVFGFSRGAFTVRALAGMLHVCGLVRPHDLHLVPFAAGLYQTSERRIVRTRRREGLPRRFGEDETNDHAKFDRDARDFKALLALPCRISFMGLFDTVKAFGWLYPQSFPALRHNQSVDCVRHAVALHERRALFKMTGWGERGDRVKEVWFAGDHSDVGGGHPTGNSPLADASLRWMLGEATGAGLRLEAANRNSVDDMASRVSSASTARVNDLWWSDGYCLLDLAPRVELNNRAYPPTRRPRVLWDDGRRKPADHTEHARLRAHWTLIERWSRTPSSVHRYAESQFDREDDPPIQWHPPD